MDSYNELLSSFKNSVEPTLKSMKHLYTQYQPVTDQISAMHECLKPVLDYQTEINDSLQPVIKQLQEITTLVNMDSFQAMSDLIPNISSIFVEKYHASDKEILDFTSTYRDLVDQINFLGDASLNSDQKDELLQNIEFVSNEFANASEIPSGEFDDIENEIANGHDTNVEEQNNREDHERHNYCDDEYSYFQIFLQGITSRLSDLDWQSEQAAANIMTRFYTFIATLSVSVISGKLDPIVYFIVLKLLLSLFPKR